MTSSPSLVDQLIQLLERQPGWRLWMGLSVVCLLSAEIIVGIMDFLLKGEVTADYLLTGLVVTGLVAPVTLAGLSRLLEHSRQVKVDALELQSLRVNKYMQVGLDAARMMFWELDLKRGTLSFDDSRLHWLGLESSEGLHTMAAFLDKVHPDDRAHLMKDVDRLPVARPLGKGREYRMQMSDGSWGWHRVAAEVAERDAHGRATVLAGGTVNVTAFKQSEFALRASEDRANRLAAMLRLVSDNVPDMIWAKDLEQHYLFANKAMCEQLLCAGSTDQVVGLDDLYFAQRERDDHPDNPLWHTYGESCRATDSETLRQGKALQFEESGYVRGRWMVLDAYKAPLLDDHGLVIGTVGSARDVTAQRAAQDKLRLASMVLEHSSEALLATDADNRIVDVNPAFTTLTGYTRDEVIGQTPSILNSGRQGADFFKTLWHELHTRGRWQGELWNRRKNGQVYAEWLTINTIYHEDGSVHRRVALFSDVTEKKLAEELIWRQANFDTLTGLPNRRMFMDRLGQGLIKAQRSSQKLVLLYLDLDHFKEVNDTLGHEAGDMVLNEAARRISGCVRASDTVARLAGDEFTVILDELVDPARVEGIALNIIAALAQPFDTDEHRAQVTVSIGVTVYPDDGADINRLMENADQAMYEAKRAGRNRCSFFTCDTRLRVQCQIDLMDDLRLALSNGQLALHYQPIVDLQTGELRKVEALLRWHHPQRGLIGPDVFVPLAEECGLIHPLGEWVFEQALAQAQHWSRAIRHRFKISLNLSPLQLLQAQVQCMAWQQKLTPGGLGGENFVIEISEDLLQDDSLPVAAQLQAFQDAGVGVSVDHAGAGLATFLALKRRSVDYFKIEKATIHQLAPDSDALAIVHALVVMAHHLDLKVIAEGVETLQQHRLLCGVGCDLGQGFFYARPMPGDEIEALFARAGHWDLTAGAPRQA
jgi:diguanylate cyclase (GGDEF)-like protein/PAS domain S-box-containing protein